MEPVSSFALASGLSWASGFRLYATVFAVGVLNKFGYIHLPTSLDILSDPILLALSGILSMIEFLADKIPYIDTAWDSFQGFIRIPAGALLAMGAINSADPLIATIVALLGGSLAGATHITKAGSRAAINASPEPVTNIAASFGEETALITGGWLVFNYPVIFLSLLATFILIMMWLIPKFWRGIKWLLFGKKSNEQSNL